MIQTQDEIIGYTATIGVDKKMIPITRKTLIKENKTLILSFACTFCNDQPFLNSRNLNYHIQKKHYNNVVKRKCLYCNCWVYPKNMSMHCYNSFCDETFIFNSNRELIKR